MNNLTVFLEPFTNLPIVQRIQFIFHSMLFHLIEAPLLRVYLDGPDVLGVGFWAGQDQSQVCSHLTKVPSDHWDKHPYECEELIHKRFHSYVILLYVLLYFGLMCSLYGCLLIKMWTCSTPKRITCCRKTNT